MRIVSKAKNQMIHQFLKRRIPVISSLNRNQLSNNKRNYSHHNVTSTFASAKPFSTSSSIESLQNQGILDEHELLRFNTLHELQRNACAAFPENTCFGTYVEQNQKGDYEWMTYQDFGEKVNQCRSVLKDLGTFHLYKCLFHLSCIQTSHPLSS